MKHTLVVHKHHHWTEIIPVFNEFFIVKQIWLPLQKFKEAEK